MILVANNTDIIYLRGTTELALIIAAVQRCVDMAPSYLQWPGQDNS